MLEQILKKLVIYQFQAFCKPVYFCTALLDPFLKTMAFYKKTRNAMDMNIANIKRFFINHATYFELPIKLDITVIESLPMTTKPKALSSIWVIEALQILPRR